MFEAQGNFGSGPPATLPGRSKFILARGLHAMAQSLALFRMVGKKPMTVNLMGQDFVLFIAATPEPRTGPGIQ